METPNFKAIICGAGPVGLVMAHALSKADIDFVVLEEQPAVVRFVGAGLTMFPNIQRALDQIGVLQAMMPLNVLQDEVDLTAKGKVLRTFNIFGMLAENFGYESGPISRAKILEALYLALPERETRVKTGASVFNVETDAAGVRVLLKDGSTVEGSIVIGCDGCHSKTRAAMVSLLKEAGEQFNDSTTAPAYYGIYGRVDNPKGIPTGVFFETRDTGRVCQLFGGEKVAFFTAMKTIPDCAAVPRRYTEMERDAHAREFSDLFVQPGMTFGELWAQTDKASAVLVNQEQAYIDKWHHGRIVLVGDSQTKITSISGQGFSTGGLSAVQLANELHATLVSSQGQPSLASLEEAFARYQKARERPCQAMSNFDMEYMKRVTWSSWGLWLMDRWIMCWIDMLAGVRSRMFPVLSFAPILDFVPFGGKAGLTPWLKNPKPASQGGLAALAKES